MNNSAPTRADFAVIERSDARWARLRELIELHSLKRGDFTLSSGGKSTYLFQLRQTTMLPEGAKISAMSSSISCGIMVCAASAASRSGPCRWCRRCR